MIYQFKGDCTDGLSVSPLFFELEAGVTYLSVKAAVSKSSILQWYLYNPSGSLHGQGFHMGSGGTAVMAPGRRMPYGASGCRLGEGCWVIWAVCLAAGEAGQDNTWALDITYGFDASGLPEPEEAPAVSWLDCAGAIDGGYLRKSYCSAQAWYRGDFHVHTTCSDGKMPPSRINREARGQALDFFAVTDHNFIHTGWTDASIPVIPGVELTLREGHFNLFYNGTPPMFRQDFWRNIADNADCAEILLKAAGEAVISVNHPFMRPWEVKDGSLDASLPDAMEIICDPSWSTAAEAADKALKAFSILWNRGIRIAGIGGSDLHQPPEEPYEGSSLPVRIGLPTTWVLAEELSVPALLKGLTEHRVYVSMGFKLDVFAEYFGAIYAIGSHIPVADDNVVSFAFYLSNNDKLYYAELVENGVTTEKFTVDGHEPVCFIRKWNGCYHWLRIDIRDAEGRLCGFTNPFYSGEKETEKTTWGNLVELIEGT